MFNRITQRITGRITGGSPSALAPSGWKVNISLGHTKSEFDTYRYTDLQIDRDTEHAV